MYDTDQVVLNDGADTATGDPAITQVVFIDPRVSDIQDLLNGLQPGVVAVVLDPTQDGLQQIADYLTAHHLTGLAAIDIVGHGLSGQIDIGSTAVNDAALADHAAALTAIGSSLATGGDLALYGCDVAAGNAGQHFIADLSAFAGGVDVAAADHAVGGAAQGGDFTLNSLAGPGVSTAPGPFTEAAIAGYQGLLDPAPTKAEVIVVGTAGGANNELIFADDNGGVSPSQTTFFTPGSANYPAAVDNNLELVAVDPLHNKYFLVVTNNGEQKILEGTLNPDENNAAGTHALTAIFSDTLAAGQITGIAVDASTSTVYFTEGKQLESVSYTGTGLTVQETSTDPLNGLTLDTTNHIAYFFTSTEVVKTNAASTAITTSFTNGLLKDTDYRSAGTGLTSITLAASGGGSLPGELAAIAITKDHQHLLLGTDAASGSDSGLFDFALTGNAAGDVTTLWSQKTASGTAVTGDVKGVAVDVNGDYYVTVADNATSSKDGVYTGEIADSNKSPTLLLSMPQGASGLEPAGLTVDVPPTLAGVTGTSTHAIQGGSGVTILTTQPTITDPDAVGSEITSATVLITDGHTGDVLSADTSGTSITATYVPGTKTLTLTGIDTFADYQKVLATVKYTDGATDLLPDGTNPTRHIDITVNDGLADSNTSEIIVTENRPPTVVNETAKVVETATISGTAGVGGTGVLAGDHDLDGTALSIQTVSGGSIGAPFATTYGHVTVNGDGSYTYVADNAAAIGGGAKGSHLTDTINYVVVNAEGLPANAHLTVTLDRVPTVAADSYNVLESASVSGTSGTAGTGVLGNDSDADGDPLSVTAVNGSGANVGSLLAGTYGHLTLNANGSFSYSADNTAAIDGAATGAHLTDTFTYTDSDGQGGTTTTTVTFTVDRPPTTVNDTNSAVELGSAATGNVLVNDSDRDGDTLTVSAVTGGTVGTLFHGTYGDLTLNADGSYTYAAGATPTEESNLAAAAPGSEPSEAFTYTASDGHGGTTTATLTLTVDRLPTLIADFNTAVQGGGAVTGNVLSDDTDKDGQSLIVSAFSDVSNGSGTVGAPLHGVYGDLTLNANGTYSYQIGATPGEQAALAGAGAGAHSDSFTYAASDGAGGTAQSTLTILADRVPVTTPQSVTVVESATDTVGAPGLLTGDTDPDGDSLTVTAVSGGTVGTSFATTYGHLKVNADGSFTYAADNTATIDAAPGGSRPSESVTLTVSDGLGGSTSELVTFSVDRAPSGTTDSYQAIKDTPLSVLAATGVLVNDSDPDTDGLTAVLGTGPAHAASFTLNADGSFNYTPVAGYTGGDSFTYRDDDGTTTGALVTVNINVINAIPTPAPDTAQVHALQTVSADAAGGLLSNDTDPNAETLTVTGISDASNGAGTVGTALSGLYGDLTVNADGSYSYTAGVTVAEQNALAAAATGSHPDDVFTYKVTNTDGFSNTSTLTVSLDRDPSAVTDANTAVQGGAAATGNVLANDSDPDGDSLSIAAISGGAVNSTIHGLYGDFKISVDGLYTYSAGATAAELSNLAGAPAGSHPTETFTYTESDGNGGTQTSTVTFTIDRLPTTGADTNTAVQAGAAATGNVLTNDSDLDGDSLTVSAVAGGTVGTKFAGTYGDITLNANGTYTYAAGATVGELANLAGASAGSHPTEVITYTADDGHGGTTTNTLTITVDRLPSASNDTNAAVQSGPAATGNVLTNDSDIDGDTLTVTAVTGGTVGTVQHGTFGDLTLNANGTYSYSAGATPTELANLAAAAGGGHPTESFTYTESDGKGGTATATLTVTLDRLPTVAADTNTAVQAGPAATGNVLTNDSDKDGDTLTVSAVSGGTIGTQFHGTYGDLTLNANGSYSYSAGATATELANLAAAPAGSHPTETFTYTDSDGKGGTAQSTLTITLDRLPTAVNDTDNAGIGFPASGNVLTNDTDKDGDTLVVTAASGFGGSGVGATFHGKFGDLTLNANGSYTYTEGVTPTEQAAIAAIPVGTTGVDVFSYTESDGKGGSSTASLSILLNQPPVAVADVNTAVQGGPAATGNVLSNDSDPDGDPITVTAVSGGTVGVLEHGTYGDLTLNANGTYTYLAGATAGELTALLAAPAGSHPTEAFTYTISDGKGGTASTTLTLTLDRVPLATADTNTAVQSGPAATGNVLTNDSDKDGDTLTISAVTGGTVGTVLHGKYGDLTLNANGTYTYLAGATAGEAATLAAAPAGSHPTESFTYTESDGHGGSASSTLTITLDRLPTAVAEGAELLAGGSVVRTSSTAGTGALAGDADKDGDVLTVTALSGGTVGVAKAGTYGTLTLNANGSYTYAANNAAAIAAAPLGSHPTDVFNYTISDGHGGTIPETLTLTIDRAPTITGTVAGQADDDQHTINPFAGVTVTEPDSASKVETVKVFLDTAAKGTFTAASLAASGFTAVPASGSPPGPGSVGNPIEYDFTGTAAAATAALHLLVFAPTPNHVIPGATETTTFNITVNDGISPTVSDNATTVNTLSINDAPTALTQHNFVEELHSVTGSVLTGDSDPDKSDTFSLTGASVGAGAPQPVSAGGTVLVGTYGTLTIKADGTYSYVETTNNLTGTATHTDTFTYQLTDSHSASSTNTLSFTITDDGLNSVPPSGPPQTILGGSNGHYLVGGGGATTFQYNAITDSPVNNPDLIANFDPSKGDIIDLTHLDANTLTPAHDSFNLVSHFDGHAGELVLQAPNSSGYWHLYGDTNGDGVADFAIAIHVIGPMDPSHIHH